MSLIKRGIVSLTMAANAVGLTPEVAKSADKPLQGETSKPVAGSKIGSEQTPAELFVPSPKSEEATGTTVAANSPSTTENREIVTPSPSANLTFKEFTPVKGSEVDDKMTASQIVRIAHEHGLISNEVVNDKKSNAYAQFIEAIRAVKVEQRGLALNRTVTSLSNLVESEVFTVSEARDIMMRHTNAANYITTRLNGKFTEQAKAISELDRSKSKEYYKALMQVESVADGNRLLDRLKNDSQQHLTKN